MTSKIGNIKELIRKLKFTLFFPEWHTSHLLNNLVVDSSQHYTAVTLWMIASRSILLDFELLQCWCLLSILSFMQKIILEIIKERKLRNHIIFNENINKFSQLWISKTLKREMQKVCRVKDGHLKILFFFFFRIPYRRQKKLKRIISEMMKEDIIIII